MAAPRVVSFVALAAVGGLVATAGCTNKVNNVIVENGPGGETPARRESLPCKTGDVTLPIEAFDINESEASGKVCDLGNVLDDDGNVGALDWAGDATTKIDGRDVAGCAAVEFSEGVTISSFIMKMRPVSAGCGHACVPGDHGCGTPDDWKLDIFIGKSLGKLKHLQELSLTTADMFEYRVSVLKSHEARFAVICRQPAWPATGDDLAIDWLGALCH